MGKGTTRYLLKISGIVQGVGFRPFLYRLADTLSLVGFVRNTSFGVTAEIEGPRDACDAFLAALRTSPPPLSRITSVDASEISPAGGAGFRILGSEAGEHLALISPDIGICADCRAELFDPKNRRYHYPFINCTNCGPRFTIVKDIPYDRPNTTMSAFPLCPDCLAEYTDPRNRRFHAQPNACPVCGPALTFLVDGRPLEGDPIALFDRWIAEGKTVAVKGLGGYNLACDAQNEDAVRRLRANKLRYDKPFAVMARDVKTVREFCALSKEEEALLTSQRAPIVLLNKLPGRDAAPSAAPRNTRLGMMLPYTPLHCLLTEHNPLLVMTSANISERPMIFRDAEAVNGLDGLADAIVTHNREIRRRVDDSVYVVTRGAPHAIRRARGYAPEPVALPGNQRRILALGAQQKNTFCIVKGENAFLSGHIGDLDDPDTEQSYSHEIDSYIRIFEAPPEVIVCDRHPDYLSTRYAERFVGKLPVIRIQHHRAHFASVLAENQVSGDAIGMIFDGTGYGDDGTIWGGEAFAGNAKESKRLGHLLPFYLAGGEAAVRDPWRCAAAVLELSLGRNAAERFFPGNETASSALFRAHDAGLNCPVTTSMGRLFDAVAAIAGLRLETTYEGQAAVELEQAADPSAEGSYRFEFYEKNGTLIFDWRQLIQDAARDAADGLGPGIISARFHRACIGLLVTAAERLREKTGSTAVVLSGGCFQNELLLANGMSALERHGFLVYTNMVIPVNDGGISYGQAASAANLEVLS